LVLSSTVLSPIVTPVALQVFGEMASEEYERVLQDLAAYGSGAFLGLWIVLPSVLGLGVRFAVPEARLTAVMPFIKLINAIVLLLLNYSNGSVSPSPGSGGPRFPLFGGDVGNYHRSLRHSLRFRIWVEPSVQGRPG